MERVGRDDSWTFSVEGMHCAGCIRKLQEVASHFKELSNLKIDFGSKMVKAKSTEGFDPEPFIEEVSQLGFAIRVIPDVSEEESAQKSIKMFLARVGVAGACAGNIMLISIAGYVGGDLSEFATLFSWLSFSFFLPAALFSAWPFYKNSYLALRYKKVSVDVPIAIAIVGGGAISTLNLLRGGADVYFDSISMFIFFLLSSRYLIFKVQNRYLSPVALADVYSQPNVTLMSNDHSKRVDIHDLNVGDTIHVFQGEFIPIDGVVKSDFADVDNSFFSGESLPERVKKWSPVFAGAKVLSKSTLIEVKKKTENTRMSTLINKLNRALTVKTPMISLTDRGAHYLSLSVVLIASLYFVFYSFIDWEIGLNRILALLVVACPCALAIATPLAQSLSVKRALKNLLLVKKAAALEKLHECKSVVFDKTGTLTEGNLEVFKWIPREPDSEEKALIASMEERSEHPVARALLQNLNCEEKRVIDVFSETLGLGVSAEYKGDFYEIKGTSDHLKSGVGFYKNGELVLIAELRDSISPKTKDVVQKLRERGFECFLISGDKESIVQSIGRELGFEESKIFGEVMPERKSSLVQDINKKNKSLYIGDGVNDALAMSESHVSISVRSAAEAAFRASDIHLLKEDLGGVLSLLELSKKFTSTVKKNIIASFAYNLTFAGLALGGLINPLFAVILMPLSSLSVTGYTVYQLGLQRGNEV